MSKITDDLNNTLAAQRSEGDNGLSCLKRDNASKNITLSDWNQLVQGAAISVTDLVRLYNLLGTIIPKMDKSIGDIEEDAVFKSLGSDSVQNIAGTISTNTVVSNSAKFGNITANALNVNNSSIILDGTTGGVTANNVVTSKVELGKAQNGDSLNIYVGTNGEIYLDNSIATDGDANINGNVVAAGNVHGTNISATGNIDVTGNLNVKGSTVTQHQETLLIRDNIIVTNSSGAEFSTSGIVVCIDQNIQQDGSGNAYGILYQPDSDAVMIGIGNYTAPDADNSVPEFAFIPGQALPLAARYGFSDTQDTVVPKWNKGKNAFSPSSLKFDGDEASVPSIHTDRIYASLLKGAHLDIGGDNNTDKAGKGFCVVMGNWNEIQDGAQNVVLIGENLKTPYPDQQILGKFNYISNVLMWSCGNGKDGQRSNAFSTDYGGNFYISNEAYVYRRGRGVNGGATGSSTGRIRLLRENERVWHDNAYNSKASFVKFESNATGEDRPGYHGFAPVTGSTVDIVLYNNYPIYTHDDGSAVTVDGTSYYKLDNITVHAKLHIDSSDPYDSYVDIRSAYCDAFKSNSDTYAQRLDVTNFVKTYDVANDISSAIRLYY